MPPLRDCAWPSGPRRLHCTCRPQSITVYYQTAVGNPQERMVFRTDELQRSVKNNCSVLRFTTVEFEE